MTEDIACDEGMRVQATFDGELDAVQTAEMDLHRANCAACAEIHAQLSALRRAIKTEAEYAPMPAAFRMALLQRLASQGAPLQSVKKRRSLLQKLQSYSQALGGFGAGALVTASLMLFAILPRQVDLSEAVVADHVRALQPGHLLDIVSTNQHNVKPWFNGRLDFTPPVKNLSETGFPLTGGRLDYLNGRNIAALVYQRRLHPIEMLIWPAADTRDTTPERSTKNGYNLYHWTQDGMTLWVISDLNEMELAEFVTNWRGMP